MKTIEHKNFKLNVPADMSEEELNTVKAHITKSVNRAEKMEQAASNITYDNVNSNIELAPHVPANVKDLPYSLVSYITKALEQEHEDKVSKRKDAALDELVQVALYVQEFNYNFIHLKEDFKADKAITRCIKDLHDELLPTYDDRLKGLIIGGKLNNTPHKRMLEYVTYLANNEHKINELREEVINSLSQGYVRTGVYADGLNGYFSEWENLATKDIKLSPVFENKGEAGSYVVGGSLTVDKPVTFKSRIEAITAIDDGNTNLAKSILFNIDVELSIEDKANALSSEHGIDCSELEEPRITELYDKLI